jgi:hypothetical protein
MGRSFRTIMFQRGEMRMAFDHEKLDVYQLAIEFIGNANDIVERLRKGAATSPINFNELP